MEQKDKINSPKYAFFYMLTLVALGFMAVSVGMIVFQIINKNIVDVISTYRSCYSSSALKFAISAIIISTPIYYSLSWQIYKNLFSGSLDKESGIRKWLTYFILFISSVVIIGYLIATIYSFLDGELTIKFVLKALTALAISGSVFSYYLYDIKRDVVAGVKNKIIKSYFLVSLAVVFVALVSGFIFVESPTQTRLRKYDEKILEKFNSIESSQGDFYKNKKRLADNLEELLNGTTRLTDKDIEDPEGKKFEYQVTAEDKYKICAWFKASNKNAIEDCAYYNNWLNERWQHDNGYQCIENTVNLEGSESTPMIP